jgi:hypothetical protein
VVVTATTGIAAQGLSQKLPEHYGTVSSIHKFVGLKDGRYENAIQLKIRDTAHVTFV